MKNKLYFTIMCLFLILVSLYSLDKKEAFEPMLDLDFLEPEPKQPYRIPKIIHQTAPADKTKWPEVWHSCQQTWFQLFPTYKYVMWTDEDLNDLIQKQYPDFWDIYKSYDKNIKRFDVARYFILYKYGGIYADMDYECFQNFENLIPQDKVSISESPHVQNEYIQNALMISPKGHPFWNKVIEKAKTRADKTGCDNNMVLYQTGPQLVSDTYFENTEMVNILPKDKWNPDPSWPYNPSMICRHLGTYSWR